MKKLIISAFVAVPFLCGQAIAGGCNYGQHAKLMEHDASEELELVADELDPGLLALWLKEQKEKKVLELSPVVTYN